MKKLNILLFIFLIAVSCMPTYVATNNIFKQLPDGAVLVRLQTYNRSLEALKGRNNKLYRVIKKERDKRIKEEVEAFRSFTLCPVYFFYSTHSRQVMNKNFEGILLDFDLKPVEPLPKLDNNYVIAEFGTTKGDTIHVPATEISYNKKGDIVSEKEYTYAYETRGLKVNALVLYSPDFVGFHSPYPYFARTFEKLPIIERTKRETVLRLQEKIINYLAK